MTFHGVDRGHGIAAMAGDMQDSLRQGQHTGHPQQGDAIVIEPVHGWSSKTGSFCMHPLLTTCCQD
jgi:hypothetical protein